MSAHPRRRPLAALAALAVVAVGTLAACSDDDSDAAVSTDGTVTTSPATPADGTTAPGGAPTTIPVPDPEVTTGILSGAARLSCGPVAADQLEPVAALLRARLAGVEGAEVGTSAGSPGFLLLAIPSSVGDAEAAAVCDLPRVDVRPIVEELAPDATGTPADGVFANEFANRTFRLGPVLADATTFNPDAIAQEIHGSGWLVATTLTADGTAVWTNALDVCFRRTADCPTGDLAYLVDDRVVVTGAVAAPLGETPAFSLPGTWSEETATRLAALIDVTAAGEFAPAAG